MKLKKKLTEQIFNEKKKRGARLKAYCFSGMKFFSIPLLVYFITRFMGPLCIFLLVKKRCLSDANMF